MPTATPRIEKSARPGCTVSEREASVSARCMKTIQPRRRGVPSYRELRERRVDVLDRERARERDLGDAPVDEEAHLVREGRVARVVRDEQHRAAVPIAH